MSNIKPSPPYYVDEDTQMMIETALNHMTQIADMQWNDEDRDSILEFTTELADRFGITTNAITVTDNEDGSFTVTTESTEKPKPQLTVIENDNDVDNVTPFPKPDK